MKLRRLFFAFLLLLAAFQFCFSQDNKSLTLFSVLPERATYEELANRIDYLAVETIKIPNAVAYIVIYGGLNPIENAFYRKSIARYIKYRRINEKDISLINSIDLKKPRFEFWISKDGTKPAVEKFDSLLLPRTNKAISFVEDAIEIVTIDGKQTYLPVGCEFGCISYVDFSLLFEFLNSNSQMKAFVIIHNKNFKKAEKVMDLISKETLTKVKILPERIKFLYGGKNKITANNYSEIEIYLAANELQLPKNSSKKYKSFN